MMLVAVSAVWGAVGLIGLRWWLQRPSGPQSGPSRSILDERLLDYVVVTLKSGSTFAGVLYVEDIGAVVLAKAEQVARDGTRTPADGEIVLLRDSIDFIQRP